jgi:hypothetical protein
MIRSAWIGVAAIIALISGCGHNSSPGTPVAGERATPAPETTSTPSRPRELRLNGKDPCALVPTSDWVRFHIEKPGKRKQDEILKSPECFYSNSVGAFDIKLVMAEGIETWRGGQRAAQPTDVEPVQGFPAISLHRPDDRTGCDVAVDVADGQYLLATVIVDIDKISKLPERCEYAHQLAESAMNTLVAT